ncbi:MAG: hypothetical protein R3279_05460 [Putridiphycobacter sp.]|nr:hypothetical protein [Putridiphycobacter sp.]
MSRYREAPTTVKIDANHCTHHVLKKKAVVNKSYIQFAFTNEKSSSQKTDTKP